MLTLTLCLDAARPMEARVLGAQRTEEPLTTQPVQSADGSYAVAFRDLGVDEVICTALEAAGIYTTFPIQALTLPLAIDGQDILSLIHI